MLKKFALSWNILFCAGLALGHNPYAEFDYLWRNKEALLESKSPSALWEMLFDTPASEQKRDLVQWFIQNGLDPSSNCVKEEAYESTPLDITLEKLIDNALYIKSDEKESYEQMLALLLESGASCDNKIFSEILENNLEPILEHPEIILEKKQKYLIEPIPPSDSPRIPPILHHMWFTHPDDPHEIRDEDLAQVIANKRCFESSKETWTHIVWVGDPHLTPHSVKTLLEAGITVKSIDAYASELSNYPLIKTLIAQKKWGLLTDTLRFSIIEYFGGTYADLNFVFTRPLSADIRRYDFIAEDYIPDSIFVDSYCFSAKPHHPIIQEANKIIARNLGPTPPHYLTEIKNPNRFTDFATANAFYISYLKQAHTNGTIDVVYPLYKTPEEEAYDSSEDALAMKAAHNRYFRLYPQLAYTCPGQFRANKAANYVQEHNRCPCLNLSYGYDGENGSTWKE